MPSRTAFLVATAALLASARSAPAQCRQLTLAGSVPGAVDAGHAILHGYGGPAHVRFYAKVAGGWAQTQTTVIGDQIILHPIALAIDGDRALAGTAEATTAFWLSGRAFVFDRVGSTWTPTELVSTTITDEDFFGASVALDGDVAVVRAAHGPVLGDGLARLHVFELVGASWIETAQINTPGNAIDVDGDTLVVGYGSVGGGHVDTHRKIGGLWVWVNRLQQAIPYFGGAVALDGERLVVAASWPPSASGQVRVFRREGTYWLPSQTLVPADSQPGDRFGTSVALSGGTLLVGAEGYGAGVVHRYEHDGASFVHADAFGPTESAVSFGRGVSIDGEDAFIQSGSTGSFYRLGIARQDSFCPTTPNSTGAHGALRAEGCDSVSGMRLTLVAEHLPPGALAMSIFGASTTQIPFGDGFRCVASPLFRLPSSPADPLGVAVHAIDFTSGPASQFASGQTWRFQTVHRDHASAGAGFNSTNAISIALTP